MSQREDKFTGDARWVLTRAQEEAIRLNQPFIGTEHLLLGLVRDDTNQGARILTGMGLELRKIRSSVEFIISNGPKMDRPGEIGLTPRARKAIELAVDEANMLKHDYVGSEHLLLGLIREGEGIAVGVLQSFDATLEKTRARVRHSGSDDHK